MLDGILRGWGMQEAYIAYIELEKGKHQTAKKLGLKECQRCGLCCLQRPCIPTPSEIEPIANFLGLNVEVFVKTYTIADRQSGTGYFLRWIKEGQEDIAGEFAPWERTYDKGYCIFYDKGRRVCKIYPVRPKDARRVNCWHEVDYDILEATKTWNEVEVEKFLPGFERG